MKKNYEKRQLIFSLSFLLFIGYLFFVSALFTFKFTKYILINGNVLSDEIVEVLVDNHELKYLKANRYVYVKDKKYKKEIIEVNRNVLKNNKKNYHQVKIKMKVDKKYKEFDNIVLKTIEKHEKLYKIFSSCWKEEEK